MTQAMFDAHVEHAIDLIRNNNFKEAISTVNNNLVVSMTRIFKVKKSYNVIESYK
jgi:hypothetical protein